MGPWMTETEVQVTQNPETKQKVIAEDDLIGYGI